MKPSHDSAMNEKATCGGRRSAHRPSVAPLLVLVLAASLAALLPNAAQAHQYGPPGGNGEEINITPDGYNEPFHLMGRNYQVEGRDFLPNDFVYIFQCAETATNDLDNDCQPLVICNKPLNGQLVGIEHLNDCPGQLTERVPTDSSGTFSAQVFMRQSFSSKNQPYNPLIIDNAPFGTEVGGVTCAGSYGVQCTVVAAQLFVETNTKTVQSIRQAGHRICFEGINPDRLCAAP